MTDTPNSPRLQAALNPTSTFRDPADVRSMTDAHGNPVAIKRYPTRLNVRCPVRGHAGVVELNVLRRPQAKMRPVRPSRSDRQGPRSVALVVDAPAQAKLQCQDPAQQEGAISTAPIAPISGAHIASPHGLWPGRGKTPRADLCGSPEYRPKGIGNEARRRQARRSNGPTDTPERRSGQREAATRR